MDDPREVVNSDDCLTEDSQYEVNDLLKEFEAKLEEAKRKKRERKAKKAQNVDKPLDSPFQSKEKVDKASVFIDKLNQYSYSKAAEKAMSIDYSKRVFEFGMNNVTRISEDSDEQEKHSGYFLRKRYTSSKDLESLLLPFKGDLKILRINKLLAKVNKSNNYMEPMYNNWCYVGFVLKKDIGTTKDKQKYLKMAIGDFDRSIDVMFFGKTVEKYWKLALGDIVFILNPIVKKYFYQPEDSKLMISGFSLSIDEHNLNSVLEIGSVKDFGFCTGFNKKANTNCQNPVNLSKTDMCEFHINLKFKSISNKRMELNGTVPMKSPKRMKFNNFNEQTEVTKHQPGFLNDPIRFQNPSLLSKESQRRKLIDFRANKSLEKKLANLGHNSTVKTLKLAKESRPDAEIANKLLETKQRSFPVEMIGKIGFDPTQNDTKFNGTGVEGYKSPTRKRKEIERVRELYELSADKSKTKQLTSSTENIKQKKDKWNTNSKLLKRYEDEIKQREINLTASDRLDMAIRQRSVQMSGTINDNLHLEPGFSSSDDSELEIEFENDDAKKQFQKKIGYKAS